jgi:AhpD family alkylhydroperoxidase
MENNKKSLITPNVKELIAISAAVACNCEMCFKFHFDKARQLGVSDDDMFAAVETGVMVKNASAQSIKDLAYKYLKKQEPNDCSSKKSCCS